MYISGKHVHTNQRKRKPFTKSRKDGMNMKNNEHRTQSAQNAQNQRSQTKSGAQNQQNHNSAMKQSSSKHKSSSQE